MAIQVLPKTNIGTLLGESLGTGLGQGLQTLLQNKMDQLTKAKQAKGIEAVGGFTPEQAQQISNFDPATQREIIKQKMKSAGNNNFNLQQKLSTLESDQIDESDPTEAAPIKTAPMVETGTVSKTPSQTISKPQTRSDKLRNILDTTPMNMNDRSKVMDMYKDALKNEREDRKEIALKQKEIDKKNKDYITKTRDLGRAADDELKRLDRMEQLINKKNLSRPRFHSFLNTLEHGIFGLGINLHSLETADTQEFNKLSAEFIRNIKEMFSGGKITNNELEAYLKMIPTASMSRAGKRRVINNLKLYAKARKIRTETLESIIKESHGKNPDNINALVEERARKRLDALENQFKENMDKIIESKLAKKSAKSFLPSYEEIPSNPISSSLDLILGKG